MPTLSTLRTLSTFTWDFNPILLELGPLKIHYYGLFFASSLMLAYILLRYMCKKKKLSLETLDELVLYIIIGLVIGARLGHIVFYQLEFYMAHPVQIFKVWEGGLASHGGAIGAFIAYLIFLWQHKKVKFWSYLDLVAIAASMPIALIRMGNFFNSEIVGRASDVPWAVEFLRYDTVSRHPSQIYEFLIGLALFTILFTIWKKFHKRLPDGFFLSLMLTLYFAARFFVEFVKEYPLHEEIFNLTTGQLLSIPGVILGAILLWHTSIKNTFNRKS